MHHIIYMSQATRELSPMELVGLLLRARDSNADAGITGILVYGGGRFMQILEGEEAAVIAAYERIIGDARHRNLFKLADKAITQRSFSDWSMAFQELSPGEFDQIVGFTSPAEALGHLPTASSTADLLLLERMREVLRADSKE